MEKLIPAPRRAKNGRRRYSEAEVRRLVFIRHGRALGFELEDIRSLLDLAGHPDCPYDEANRIALTHLAGVDERLAHGRRRSER